MASLAKSVDTRNIHAAAGAAALPVTTASMGDAENRTTTAAAGTLSIQPPVGSRFVMEPEDWDISPRESSSSGSSASMGDVQSKTTAAAAGLLSTSRAAESLSEKDDASALIAACEQGESKVVRGILYKNNKLPIAVLQRAMNITIKRDNWALHEFLCSDLNLFDPSSDDSALVTAAQRLRLDEVTKILDDGSMISAAAVCKALLLVCTKPSFIPDPKNPYVKIPDNNSFSNKAHIQIVKELFSKRGKDISDKVRHMALMGSPEHRSDEFIVWFVDQKYVEPIYPFEVGPALLAALKLNRPDMARDLLTNGCKIPAGEKVVYPDITPHTISEALKIAAKRGYTDIVKLIYPNRKEDILVEAGYEAFSDTTKQEIADILEEYKARGEEYYEKRRQLAEKQLSPYRKYN